MFRVFYIWVNINVKYWFTQKIDCIFQAKTLQDKGKSLAEVDIQQARILSGSDTLRCGFRQILPFLPSPHMFHLNLTSFKVCKYVSRLFTRKVKFVLLIINSRCTLSKSFGQTYHSMTSVGFLGPSNIICYTCDYPRLWVKIFKSINVLLLERSRV